MNFQASQSELTECDREPIHQIAAVQNHGGLIALNADWVVAHKSANCPELLGLNENFEIGAELSKYFQPRAMEQLREAVGKLSGEDQVERLFGLRLTHSSRPFDVAIHQSHTKLVIEFEPHAVEQYADHLSLVGPLVGQLGLVQSVDELCEKATTLIREMLQYDRVMVYRFHPDDSGEVIAEAKRDDLQPYLGLRYPAADIPVQARELFVRNRFRVIGDTNAEPIAIEPKIGIDGEPLDLSMSVLRSHSRMHVQYMVNMGVAASLSIAIVRQDRLWGLISCHHGEPRVPPYSLRTVAEMFSQMFSLMLDRLLLKKSDEIRIKGRAIHDQLMIRLAGGSALSNSLPMIDKVLQDVIAHDGTSVFIDGRYTSSGHAPDEHEFSSLLPTFNSAPGGRIIASSALSEQVPAARDFSDRIGGALVLPMSRRPRDFLVLWRKPLAKTVTWAGDPEKAVANPGERLQPRGSFEAWEQTVVGRSDDWTDDELQIAEGLRVTLLEVVLRMSDEVARERARAQEQQELLIAELNHRVRNILNLIRSLVNQSQHDAADVVDFSRIIGGRISALASAHDNITRENWAPAPLSALFETEVEAYVQEKKDRFVINGEEVLIKPEAYTVMALVAHELVTNSAKYGSLCDRHGALSIDIRRNRLGDLQIQWRERGGPPVKPPTRRGFGSTIIERSIPFELKGEAELRFKLAGLEADFVIPARYVETTDKSFPKVDRPFDQPQTNDIEPRHSPSNMPDHVLLVEDSMIIALDTEESLRTMGVASVAVASSVAGAIDAIKKRRPDFAIVDFNLGIESSEPVAANLRELGVPFVLATGYAEMSKQIDEIGAQSLLRKPYGKGELEELFGMQPN